VDQLAASKGLILAGYYLANENINDLKYDSYVIFLYFFFVLNYTNSLLCSLYSTDRPAHRIADKIAENFNSALLVVVRLLVYYIKMRFTSISVNFIGFCCQVDNREVTLGMGSSPLRISQSVEGKWKPKDKAK